jgi:hypothetical protein
MLLAAIARISSVLSAWALLGAMWWSSLAAGASPPCAVDPAAMAGGTYIVTGTAPTSGNMHAHPDVQSSEDWYVREVRLNAALLVDGVDYSVVDNGSNKGVIVFTAPLQRGDELQVSGPTLEPGPHGGTILFF